jgi:hypothetical protein
MRVSWKAVLVSKDLLVNARTPVSESLLIFDQKAADAFARATQGKIAVPGVRFDAVESLSVRSV